MKEMKLSFFILIFIFIGTNSFAEKILLANKNWNSEFSSTYSSPVNTEIIKPSIDLSTDFSYKLFKTSSISFGLQYTHQLTDETTENNSHLDEAYIRYLKIIKSKGSDTHFNYFIGFNPPVNKFDSIAGFNGAIEGNVVVSKTYDVHTFSFTVLPKVYSYQYDTASPAGTEYNKKWSYLLQISSSSDLTDRFKWANGIGLFQYENYYNGFYQTYTASSEISLKLNAFFEISARISSNDKVISERQVFADNNTYYLIGLKYIL